MTSNASSILHALNTIKSSLCDALSQPHTQLELLRQCLEQFMSIKWELEQSRPGRSFDKEESDSIAAAAESIGAISQLFADTENFLVHCLNSAVEGASQVLTSPSASKEERAERTTSKTLRSSPPADGADQMLNSTIMRKWMMQHLDHPFPNADERVAITKESNENGIGPKGELNPNQVSEYRRRRGGGWYPQCPFVLVRLS